MKVELFGGDTEDDSKGNPSLFGFVSARGSWHTASREDALLRLLALAERAKRRGARIELWFTNLEYDLVNLFGVDRLREVSLRFGRSYLIAARWKGIEFRDTLRHVPASVAELGALVGLEKRESGLFDNRAMVTREKLTARLMRDAAITYRAARLIYATYRRFRQRASMTLPATAYRVWRDQFWKREVWSPDPEIWEAGREAYYGGRTEPFALGTYKNVHAIDAASMFPWAMLGNGWPVPWAAYRRVNDPGSLQANGLYRASVDSSLDIPALPYRSREGLVFPNGRFTGWWTGEELTAFGERGGRIRVRKGIEFLSDCEPFTDYVRKLFRLKNRTRGPMRQVYKLMLNGLYGKFGQGGARIECVPLEKFERMAHGPADFRVWNGLVIWRHVAKPPPWSCNVWPALVTARARVRLLQEIERVKKNGGRPLYCDTDSVIFSGPPQRYPQRAPAPGTFESRGDYGEVLIVGKKEYGLRRGRTWEIHVKGVPRRERELYLREGKATFERPVRLREGMMRGKQPNVWSKFTKQRRVNYDHRGRRADGSLSPVHIA